MRTQSRSHETHASIYRTHIQEVFGAVRLDDITEEDVLAFNSALLVKPLSFKNTGKRTLAHGTIRGKRGGARVIYYHWVSKEQCYLLYAYAKNVSANLTSQQLQRLAEVMQAEIRDE